MTQLCHYRVTTPYFKRQKKGIFYIDSESVNKLSECTKSGDVGQYLLHSYICSNLSTDDSEKNLYPDLVPTAKDLKDAK